MVKYVVGITGSRGITSEAVLMFLKDLFIKDKDKIIKVITGGAMGVDTLAMQAAAEVGIPFETYRPKDPNNKKDYILRNFRIVDDSDKIYAIWDGTSPGTKSTINYTKKTNKYLMVIRPKREENEVNRQLRV